MSATDRASFAEALRGGTPQIGMWVASGSPLVAEICAGSGIDWLLIDSEHAPNDVRSLLPQLQACAAYDVHVVVRPPVGDTVMIKQFLDIGVRNLLIPMVESADQAQELVRATRYPPAGVRGVGSALARASRWNRVSDYLPTADAGICLTVQIESRRGIEAIEEIVAVDGIDGVFIGPADLAASMGHLGKPDHPAVVAAVDDAVKTISALGKPAGVNAFQESRARGLIDLGARFVLVGADVALLARGSEELAARYR
ncbi:aldolase/citrate lyase family protein [Streptomyces sp. GQFP]|uniref:aldolase/citrate lyase family protein n=1 Tax=Streptomyces sp. GQFP TaxID=2907545 RepID=UPI001F286E16|nr:aldolase/citrate lyase family protein [Streptomyces sp. GQFP]UIX29335.1 aldolase/citrate lyase family protein [Streptomyces sp. GQFP]